MNILIIVAFMAVLAGLAYLSLGIGAATLGYFTLVKAKGGGTAPSPYPVYHALPTDHFTFMYGAYTTGTPESFTFPSRDGVHYCLKGAGASGIAVGKTITFKFEIAGDGELKVADQTDTPPATVRLIMQRDGDNLTQADYRFWYGKTNLVNGILTMVAPIDPAQWTNVYGAVNPAGFQALINNIANLGFTFGGQSFAGHGVYCPVGTRTFRLIEYTVA